MLQTSTLAFLKNLKKNNNKPWFDQNRNKYESAKQDFEEFIQSVIDSYGKKDKTISHLKAKDCLFRINRDIRFSKNKSPYKTNMAAYMSKGGKKSPFAGYYFHCEPGKSFTGGGLWMPLPAELARVRQEIDYNLDEFKKILTSKKFKSIYKNLDKSDEFMLSRVPKGYEPDNPAAEYLRLKSFTALVSLPDEDLTSPALKRKTLTAFEAILPLIEFMNRAID